jgi:hypothetical protein
MRGEKREKQDDIIGKKITFCVDFDFKRKNQ